MPKTKTEETSAQGDPNYRRENPTTGLPGDVVTPSGAPLRGDEEDTEHPDGKAVTAMPSSQEGTSPVAGVAELNKSNPPQQQTPGGNAEGTDFRSTEAQIKDPPKSAAQIVGDKTGTQKIEAFAETYHETVPDDTVVAGRAGDKKITVGDLANIGEDEDSDEAILSFVADFPADTPDSHVVCSNGGVKLTLGDFREAVGRDKIEDEQDKVAQEAERREQAQKKAEYHAARERDERGIR